MTYFSSYYPDIEATRMDIQSRIHLLEDRLSRRADFADDIQRQEIQLNINNLYRLLKDTIESQTQLHGQIANLRSQVAGDTSYHQRLHSLENTRREAADRAALLEQQLRDVTAERRYVPIAGTLPPASVLPPTYAAERQLLEHRLRKDYSDGLISSELRRHELLRNSDRIDQLRNTQYLRDASTYSQLRDREAEIAARTRAYLGSGQKDDRFRDASAKEDNFPLKNEHLIRTNYPDSKDGQDNSRSYDTPFKQSNQSYRAIGPSGQSQLEPNSGNRGSGIRRYAEQPGNEPERVERGRDRKRGRSRSRSRSRSNDDYEDSERLLEKYTKGHRAEQIRKELGAVGANQEPGQLRNSRKNQDSLYHRPPKRISPEDHSSSPQRRHKENHPHTHQGGHVTFNHNQSLVDKSVDEKAFLMRRSRTRSRSPSESNIHRSRLKKSASKRRLKHNPEVAAKVKADAIQRIQNRLLQAWALYEDSDFRNEKHEHDHLFNTYAKEEKFRKEIREKIELQPHVQRRFGLHIEP